MWLTLTLEKSSVRLRCAERPGWDGFSIRPKGRSMKTKNGFWNLVAPASMICTAVFFLVGLSSVSAETIDLAVSFDEATTFSALTPTSHEVARRDHAGHWDLPAGSLAAGLPSSANI